MQFTEKIEESTSLQMQAKETSGKIYLKALTIRDFSDIDVIKSELKRGNIVIARITPLAKKSIDDVKFAVDELCKFVKEFGGDIARLGEERLVITPSTIKIWRKPSSTT